MKSNIKQVYAVDLDATLAYFDNKWRGIDYIGKPIPKMLARVKKWISSGIEVRIFTARADVPAAIPPIKIWLKQNGLPDLKITNIKSKDIARIYDDRAVQVQPNTGVELGDASQIMDNSLELLRLEKEKNIKE